MPEQALRELFDESIEGDGYRASTLLVPETREEENRQPDPPPEQKSYYVSKSSNFDESKHPRADDGKFGSGAGKQSAKRPKTDKKQGGQSKQPAEDPAKNRPSNPDERHVNEDGSAPLPKALNWRDPPPKTGKTGEGMKARPKGDESQTKIGDLGESLATKLGFRNILPEGKRNFTAKEVEEKGSSIDLEFDHSGRLYELKLCNSSATEYRLKAKSSEKENKLRYAENCRATPHVLVGVRNVDTGEVHFYACREPGLSGSEVSSKTFDFIGAVKP